MPSVGLWVVIHSKIRNRCWVTHLFLGLLEGPHMLGSFLWIRIPDQRKGKPRGGYPVIVYSLSLCHTRIDEVNNILYIPRENVRSIDASLWIYRVGQIVYKTVSWFCIYFYTEVSSPRPLLCFRTRIFLLQGVSYHYFHVTKLVHNRMCAMKMESN